VGEIITGEFILPGRDDDPRTPHFAAVNVDIFDLSALQSNPQANPFITNAFAVLDTGNNGCFIDQSLAQQAGVKIAGEAGGSINRTAQNVSHIQSCIQVSRTS